MKLNSLKIEVDKENPTISKVILNGTDISNKISGVSLKIKARKVAAAIIEVPCDEIELNGDFEIIKTFPKEEKEINISINNNENIDTEKVINEITNRIKTIIQNRS